MVSYVFAAAFAAGLVSAGSPHVHQRHAALHKAPSYDAPKFPVPEKANATCGCTTYTTTWYGEATLGPPAPVEVKKTTTILNIVTTTATIYAAHPSSSTTSEAPKQPPVYAPKPEEQKSSTSAAPVAPTYAAKPQAPAAKPEAPPSYNAPAPKQPPVYAPKPEEQKSSTSAAPVAPTYAAKPQAPAAKPEAPPSYNAPAPKNNGGKSPITPSGNKWAMTYTPYTDSGACKDTSSVHADIASIKAMGFNTVRLYATDCSGVQNVGSACTSVGMNLIMGIYIDAAGLLPAYAQLSELTAWGKTNGWDKVEMVVAGNEAVFNGFCSAADLANFINDVKTAFKAAGYSGPVTTTEPLNIIQENAATFCPVVDVIAANLHPFFNGGVAAADAGEFVKSQMDLLSQACHGEKEAYCLETGWPSEGNANGAAIPGVSEQKQAVDSIVSVIGGKCAIFSFENDGWKHPGDLNVEQHFGCSSIFKDLF
ncbi:putative beta-glucosidase btgE [Fulvia fulva]|uniref:Probable beta-glucosidase btgE n=1 Tax=Passalora fulva TaxID=5499 RepID=A0A9Q8LCF1_PASFU|nr:putative beta-glucosidase btgE [Fulvia fulva]KAK4629339.1 putative beta-glucosidase btgE [Fulvia fulva]KAK4630487.1 putative beta-glucosidase btgE [Fulvia fulva]UJO14831.1 putative beta-glucosidase btgE [Fulvia fulva]WPV12409.1 putative beta-glucosidase btgE [Fulvia fulva]WPV27291.1 putative beta-glucosidase btgE [Fulvia fulva]